MIDLNLSLESDQDIGLFFGENYVGKIWMRRLDLIHPVISGNKWFKLKYNIKAFEDGDYSSIVSFGGAYSNHLAALAELTNHLGIRSYGIIRGEKPHTPSRVLKFLQEKGMELIHVSRELYKCRSDFEKFADFIPVSQKPLFIPEGGSNLLGVKGAMGIIRTGDNGYNKVIVAVGSGATIAGLINAAEANQKVIGISSLKAEESYLKSLIIPFLKDAIHVEWKINCDYHFGGFAKTAPALEDMMRSFQSSTGIYLEHVYTGKVIYALKQMLDKGEITDEENILVIHTGGFGRD